jgi:hypothetical protein
MDILDSLSTALILLDRYHLDHEAYVPVGKAKREQDPGLPHQNWAEKNPGTVAAVDGYKSSASRLPRDECFHVKSSTI